MCVRRVRWREGGRQIEREREIYIYIYIGAHLNWWADFSQKCHFHQLYRKRSPKIYSHLLGGCKFVFLFPSFLFFCLVLLLFFFFLCFFTSQSLKSSPPGEVCGYNIMYKDREKIEIERGEERDIEREREIERDRRR